MQLLLLLCLMLVGALAEVLSLGAIVPFLAILADPVQALKMPLVAHVIGTLGLSVAGDVRWQFTMLFASTAAASGVVRFMLIYAISKLNYGIGHEFGAEVYRRTLYQPYEVHVARNSSEIMGGINKVDIVVWLVFSLLNTVSAIIMALFIVTALLFVNPQIAATALFGFGSIYAAISIFTRKRLASNSQIINLAYNTRVQSVQEGLGGIRDVLLDHAQPVFERRFNQTDWPMRQAQASNNIIGPSPRFAVEAIGMVLIALLGYYMTASGEGIAAAIPTLGALALGAQRLMPLLQQTYQGWVGVASNRQVLIDVIALLQQPVAWETQTQVAPLSFDREILLQKVSFRYQPQLPLVLHQLELTIKKGARVGFIGTTGSGKSTLMDLLMGLLQPCTGQILVDNQPIIGVTRLAWQHNVAHVPQAIFLADASFAENIAFGIPARQVDMERVRQAAQQAQISEFIESSSEGYTAMVGERGVRLSGGQRQRIGIARALYKRVKVLVFDEATSALDVETEAAVMQAIESLGRDLTIVLIAHRLTTLKGCDLIYRMEKGKVVSSGSYEELIALDSTPNPY
ncbi:MAG: ABC transporter ATP-binding protein [Burkholderiaceae bacterium]|nr:ABC transporter ATP-binding protein [Burkholderiaceae bacterium]